MKFKKNRTQFVIDEFSTLEKAGFAIVPVPYEMTTSYGKGTKRGPDAIIKASPQVELWDEELKKETCRAGFFTTEPLKIISSEKFFFSNIGETVDSLLRQIRGVPVFLGGEHSVSQGLIPPFKKIHKNLSVLHFDAHADLRSEYEGTKHSHASALYPVSRETKTVQIGIRSVGSDEKQYVNKGKVKTFLMHENPDTGRLIKKVLKELTDAVYLTIDVDGFDPSVMPGTGTPQPGGFGWYEALKVFRAVCAKKKIVGIDVVEVSPQENSTITEMNAAKLVYRLAGYITEGKTCRKS